MLGVTNGMYGSGRQIIGYAAGRHGDGGIREIGPMKSISITPEKQVIFIAVWVMAARTGEFMVIVATGSLGPQLSICFDQAEIGCDNVVTVRITSTFSFMTMG